MTDRETLQSVENGLESLLEIVRAQLATNVIPVPTPASTTPSPSTPASHMDPFALSILTAGYEPAPSGPPPANVPSDYLFSDFDFNALNGPRAFDNQHDRHAVTPTDDVELLMHVGKMAGNVPDYVAIAVSDPYGTIARFDRVAVSTEGGAYSFDAKGKTRYTIAVISPENFAVSIRLEARTLG